VLKAAIVAHHAPRITLHAPPQYRFKAGQYLTVQHANGTEIPMSIASPPQSLPFLELQYKPTPGDSLSQAMDECLKHDHLNITPATGSVTCPPSDESLVVVAGGSGVSLAFSCAQFRNNKPVTEVIWCVDRGEDLYATDELSSFATLHGIVDATHGHANAGLQLLASLEKKDHYILSGSPGFVYAATDILLAVGVSPQCLQSDVYDFAPRDTPLRNTGSEGCGNVGKPPTDCNK
jgi:CDP-4-dehydro-6-deoxyglucose reductase